MPEKLLNSADVVTAGTQSCWMPQAVKPNVCANPMDIIPLASYAVVQIPNALAQLVEDLDRTQ